VCRASPKYILKLRGFIMYRYNYCISNNKVVALGSFAGKPVRGIAKCDPADAFYIEDGKELAAARCEAKIAQKRVNYASIKYREALKHFEEAKNYLDQMTIYYENTKEASSEAQKSLKSILDRLNAN
jgi:hypothetical protein